MKHFGVGRATVWRFRKKEGLDDEVNDILFELANLSLKPYQLSVKGFMHIPIIQRFQHLMVRARELTTFFAHIHINFYFTKMRYVFGF